jgi:glyoxylase-like metal-dependent hydrolase (beta-lactamase superfamily II)
VSDVGAAPMLVHADNPGPYTGTGNNTWLLVGDESTLIDAGTGAASHLEALDRALDGRPLARVIVTHGHPDHASGVPALRLRWPGIDARKFPLDGEVGWAPLHDGAWIRAGTRQLQIVHTPGHAADHVCLWDAESEELYGGDMVVRPGSVLIPAGRGGNLRDYLASLQLLAALAPARIFPGHGPVIENPADVIAEYLEHRQRREDQILALVAEGLVDADAIVVRLYGQLADGLGHAARMTVQAHLEKLREEGRLPG